jgi:hypothetical protein
MIRPALFLLLITPALAAGQVVNTDSLRRVEQAAVERDRARVASAAGVFLDRARPTAARLAAVRAVAAFGEAGQLDGAEAVALDSSEPQAIRVRALQLAGARAGVDTTFARRLFALAADTAVPVDLRREAVTQLSLATFGSFALHTQLDGFLTALRAAARDPDIRIRRVALRALAGQGDRPALNMLRVGLDSPSAALLPPDEAVPLLGLTDPAPFYDLLRRLMREPPDLGTRLAAIRLLGGDAQSRDALVQVLRDARESPTPRQAALGALAAGDPARLPQNVVPVVADEAAPSDLRVRAIKAVEITRTSRDPRVFARAPDEFDRVMERLAARSAAAAVQAAARTYLARTRSPR